MNVREFITKLQNLPEQQKKIILWTVVAILAVVLGFFWVRGAINNFSKIGESIGKIELPKVDLPAAPSMPDLSALENITSTAGWKTYTNDEYGFEFGYPGSYSIEDIVDYLNPDDPNNPLGISYDTNDSNNDLVFTLELTGKEPPYPPYWNLEISKTEYKNIDALSQDWPAYVAERGGSIDDLNIDGVKAKMVNYIQVPGAYSEETRTLYVIKNQYIYLFSLISVQEKTTAEEQLLFNQMLSTFKFIPIK